MIRTEGGHFWFSFPNGYTLSCFNGYGSHTENHSMIEKWEQIFMDKNPHLNFWESRLIEIAIISPDGDIVTESVIDSDDMVKTVDLLELVEIINIVCRYRK